MSTGPNRRGDTGPGAAPGSGGPPEGLHQGSSVEMGETQFSLARQLWKAGKGCSSEVHLLSSAG